MKLTERMIPVDVGFAYISNTPNRKRSQSIKKFVYLQKSGGYSALKCECGCEITHFRFEEIGTGGTGPSPIVYRIRAFTTKDGREVEMTWDHILPKSLGGSDCNENAQVLCMECNWAKSSCITVDELQHVHLLPKVVNASRYKSATSRAKGIIKAHRAGKTKGNTKDWMDGYLRLATEVLRITRGIDSDVQTMAREFLTKWNHDVYQ